MDDKTPKEYVAKLLKQLEELKRKKALKERKLQKLKGCSIKNQKKEHSCPVKIPNFNDNSCKASNNIAFAKPDAVNMKVENESFITTKHNSQLFNNKPSYSVEETLPGSEKSKAKKIDFPIKDSLYDIKEINKREEVPVKVTSTLVPTGVDDFKVVNFSQDENKLSNNSNKSLPSSKNKSSDILDDSLNSNMSFFMSADLFIADYNDKKEAINNCTSVKNTGCPQQTEMVTELVACNPQTSSPKSLAINKSQQNSFGIFNFPKFSTPTEGITQPPNNENMLDLVLKSHTPKMSPSVEDMSHTAKAVSASDKTFKNALPSENKFDSSQLNFALEKRLSSILDAHYGSPKKVTTENKISSLITCDNQDYYYQPLTGENVHKKRKLFNASNYDTYMNLEMELEHSIISSNAGSSVKSNNVLRKSLAGLAETDREIISNVLDFDNTDAFDSNSDFFSDIKNVSGHSVTLAKNSCDDVPSQVTKTVNGLVAKVCDDASSGRSPTDILKTVDERAKINEDMNINSEVLVIPETEGLGLDFTKDTEDFLETSTLSQSLKDFPVTENVLNMSSQSKLESPVVNTIVAAVRSSKTLQNIHVRNDAELCVGNEKGNLHNRTTAKDEGNEKVVSDGAPTFDDSLGINTSFLEEDTQDLGKFKQVPYMDEVNVQDKITADDCKTEIKSNLNFTCSLSGMDSEPVIDVEIVLFNDVKYAILQHRTHIYVWRQEKSKCWIKIFNHQIEEMFSLVKICVSMDDENLVIVMLLSNDEQYCLQFLIFEKHARVIKLMENTHWLEERHSKESILLCGLNGLMFAIAQNKENPEVSIHAFISLQENPRLMTAVLGSTETPLCSLLQIYKLPNALMGISDSMLYVWHILEARLVTAVPLHPHDYIPIKECFWATVENGLIYFLTTCEDRDNYKVCQLLAANLATGFCQSAMTYSSQPSDNKVNKILKAAYLEPFLVVAHSNGALIWSVEEEYSCAALPYKSDITTVAISRDFDSWGLVAVGSKSGHINCYSLN